MTGPDSHPAPPPPPAVKQNYSRTTARTSASPQHHHPVTTHPRLFTRRSDRRRTQKVTQIKNIFFKSPHSCPPRPPAPSTSSRLQLPTSLFSPYFPPPTPFSPSRPYTVVRNPSGQRERRGGSSGPPRPGLSLASFTCSAVTPSDRISLRFSLTPGSL